MQYIYKIINTSTNKVYIGRTGNPTKRFQGHNSKLNTNNHPNKDLQNDYNFFGKDCFLYEIIDSSQTVDEILLLEQKYVQDYKKTDNCYNIMGGGKLGLPKETHPLYGKHHSEETKTKISNSKKGKTVGEHNHFYGKQHSQMTKEAISKSRKNKGTGKDNGYSKKVYVKGIIYNSVKEGRESCDMKRFAFRNRLLDKNDDNFRYVE